MILAASSGGIVVSFHQGLARVVLLYSLAVALWGLFLYLRNSAPSGGYLGAVIIDEGVIILQSLVGLLLLGTGHRLHEGLHVVYGIAAILALPTAYLMGERATDRRDSLNFGLAGLVLVGVSIRAIMTGAG